MDTESSLNIIEIPTLGRPVVLGELYSTHSHKFIPGFSLWDQESINQSKEVLWNPSSRIEFEVGESTKDKHTHLDVSAALSVSLEGGMIHVSGSATYLDDKKTNDDNAHVRLSYISQTRSESISTCLTGVHAPRCPKPKSSGSSDTDGSNAPTHVVAEITYGGNAHFDFEKHVADSDDKMSIQGELKVTINLELTKIHGSASFHDNSSSENDVKNIKINMYSDFIVEKQPSTVADTIILYRNISKYLGTQESMYNHSVPMKMTLIPIEQFCQDSEGISKQIEEEMFRDAVSNYKLLTKTGTKIEQLLDTFVATYNFPIKELLLDFKDQVEKFTQSYGANMTKVIPRVRSNPDKLDPLHDLIHNYTSSCYDYDRYLYDYLMKRTREVNAINIFYTKTVNKVAPLIAQFSKADIPKAMFDVPYVFILTLNVIPNITEEKYNCKQQLNSTLSSIKNPKNWYDNFTTVGAMSVLWRVYMEFFLANYNITKEGKESAYFIDIQETVNRAGDYKLELYVNGVNKSLFKVPEKLETKPKITRTLKGTTIVLCIDNPKYPNTNTISEITMVSVNYTLAYPRDFSQRSYKTATTDIDTTKNTNFTQIVIRSINSELSYNFTVSYMTKYGAGPPSEIFQSIGPLQILRTKPGCSLEIDTKYKSLNQIGTEMSVSQCAEKALSRAKNGSLTDKYTYTTLSTSPSTNTSNTTSTTPSFGRFWWSYNFATKKCFTIDLSEKPVVSTKDDWVSGSPACGVPTNTGSSDAIKTCQELFQPSTGTNASTTTPEGTNASTTTPEGCKIDQDNIYEGHDIPDKNYLNINDKWDCAVLCYIMSDCFYWTYRTAVETCWLKTQFAIQNKTEYLGHVSGNWHCGKLENKPL
jgi:hypothetical protein